MMLRDLIKALRAVERRHGNLPVARSGVSSSLYFAITENPRVTVLVKHKETAWSDPAMPETGPMERVVVI